MTARPRCGNDPRAQLTPGDRAAVANFRAFLTARAEEKKTVSDLDAARAALKPFEIISGFVGRLEAFEAAVRANERAGAEARRLGAPDPAPTTRATVLHEAANLIEARQDRLDAEERAEFDDLDHETVLQGVAVRDMAKHLRHLAAEESK
ncbi:hypothetical protein ACWIID_09210 [Streptomyces phaeochromogenes]